MRCWPLVVYTSIAALFCLNLLGVFTLVCVYSLQVHDMADDVVFIRNAISSQHVSGLSGNIQSFATAIPLQHRDHLRYGPVSATTHTLAEALQQAEGEKKYMNEKNLTFSDQ